MKKKYNWLAAALVAVSMGACTPSDTATFVVKTEAGSVLGHQIVGYGSVIDYGLCQKFTVGNDGNYSYEVRGLDAPRTIWINVEKVGSATLRLSPGNIDTVTISTNEVKFAGANAEYNRCLQAVDEYQQFCDAMLYGNHELEKCTTPAELEQGMRPYENRAFQVIRSADIDESFRKEQLAHVKFISRMIFIHAISCFVQEMTDEWKTTLRQLLSQPWESDYLKSYRGLHHFENVSTIKFLKLEEGNPRDIKDPYAFMFHRYEELFEDEGLEAVWANFFYEDVRNKRMTEAMLPLYDEFKRRYPNSPYLGGALFGSSYLSKLSLGMEESRRFHQGQLDEAVYHILPCDSAMTSIADVVKPFRGKVVYVDVWATWCGPCKEMFKHLPAFKEKTKDKNLVFLYLSIDRPQQADVWRKSIAYYDLKGHHILAGKELAQGIYKELGNERGVLTIPRFLLIDRDGQIVQSHAASPEELDKLLEQIENISD